MDEAQSFHAIRSVLQRHFASLAAFLASAVAVPLVFVLIGATHGRGTPAFMLKPGFITAVLACAALAVWLLRPARSLHWSMRLLIAPIITFAFLVVVIVTLTMLA